MLIDDEILTGGTAIGDAQILKSQGADSIYMIAIHPILRHKEMSPEDLIKKLENSPIEKFIVTDSVPQDSNLLGPKFEILSVASFLGEAIKRSILGQSITELHQRENVKLYL